MGRRAFVRDNILEAALTLFAREGYEAVSTRDIAKAAEVGHASMYRHFPTKEDLGRELYHRAVAPLIDRLRQHLVAADSAAAAAAFTQALYDSYDSHPKALALLIFPPHEFVPDECDHQHPHSLRAALHDWFDRGPPDIPDLSPKNRAAIFWGAVTGPLIDRYLHQRQGDMHAQASAIIPLIQRLAPTEEQS